MDFELSPSQKKVYDTVGALGRERFAPRARDYDERAVTPLANMQDFFDAGLMGLTVSEDLGGLGSGVMGRDPLLYLLAVEQTARYCVSTAHCLHIHSHGAHLVDQVGTPEQRRRILGAVVERGAMLNGYGQRARPHGARPLQPRHGSGQGRRRLRGERQEELRIARGRRRLQHPVRQPEGHARARRADGVHGAEGGQGAEVEEGSWNPMGMRAAVSPTLLLTDCFVADENVLGTPGFFPRDRWQSRSHLGFAAQYLGGVEGIFDYLVEYLPKRGTAGDGYAQLRMGEIRIGIDSVRWLVYRAAWLWQQKDIVNAELFSLVAKHRAIENAIMVMDKAAQIAGRAPSGRTPCWRGSCATCACRRCTRTSTRPP